MHVAFAFFADAVSFDVATGKLHALGLGFDVLRVAEFPHTAPSMILVARLAIAPVECNVDHRARVEFISPDGVQLHSFTTAIRGTIHPDEPHFPAAANIFVGYAGLSIDAPGDYAAHLLVNDMELFALPLHVRGLPQEQPAPTTPTPGSEGPQ